MSVYLLTIIEIDQTKKMETAQQSFHYESYRRVPMNSATTQRENTDFNSIGTYSTYSTWSRSMKTTYIDGTTMLGQYDRPYNVKDLFPKGKNRPKFFQSSEKKVETSLNLFSFNLFFIFRILVMLICPYYQQMYLQLVHHHH